MKNKILLYLVMSVLLLPLAFAMPEFDDVSLEDELGSEFEINKEAFSDFNLTTLLVDYNSSEDNIEFNITGGNSSDVLSISNNEFLSISPNPPQAGDEGKYFANISLANQSDNAELDNLVYEFSIFGDEPSLAISDLDSGAIRFSERRGDDASQVITLTNEGSYDMSIDPSLNVEGNYELTVNETESFTIPADSQREVEVTIEVPEDQRVTEEQAGDLTFNWDSNSQEGQENIEIFVSARRDIVIEEIEIFVDGSRGDTIDSIDEDGSFRYRPDDDDEEIKPDSRVTIDLVIENLNRDFEYELDISTDSDVSSADGLSERLTIRDRDDETVTFEFVMDASDFRDDFFEIEFEIEAELDDRDAPRLREDLFVTLDFDVERNFRDVRFQDTSLRSTSVSCSNPSLSIDARMINIGEDDLDTATVVARVSDISGAEETVTRSLRRGVSSDYSMTLSLDKDDVEEKDYFVELYALPRDSNSRTSSTDTSLLEFEVINCDSSDDGDNGDDGNDAVVPPTPQPQPPVVGEPVDGTDSTNTSLDDRAYLIILAALIAIVAVLIVLVAFNLNNKK